MVSLPIKRKMLCSVKINALFSVNQQASSSTSSFHMVQDVGGNVQTFASIVAQCDHKFSASMTTQTNETLVEGHIGSSATVKFVNQGMFSYFS